MKLAILDRDGTLNPLGDDYITSADEWSAVPGALEAIARLNHAGWHVVVATNQPGLGRGLFDVVALHAIHAKMHRQQAALGGRIDAVFYCPHALDEDCNCRKPAPGLLEQICERYGVEPHHVQVGGNCAAPFNNGPPPPLGRSGAGRACARRAGARHAGACQPGRFRRPPAACGARCTRRRRQCCHVRWTDGPTAHDLMAPVRRKTHPVAAIRSVIHLLWMGLTVVPYALAILLGALLGLRAARLYRIAAA